MNTKSWTQFWRWFYWGLWLGFAVYIFYGSSQQGDPSREIPLHLDKVYHFIQYCVFSYLGSQAILHTWKNIDLRKYILCLGVGCVLFALSDEIHQLYVPNRSFEWLDWLADALGICLGLGLGWKRTWP